jgi:hypothetical protein
LLRDGAAYFCAPMTASRNSIGRRCRAPKVHILDAGHFALDTKADEIAALVRDLS